MQGQINLHEDALHGIIKVEYKAPVMAYAVSMEMLHKAYEPIHVWRKVIKEMTKHYEHGLLAALEAAIDKPIMNLESLLALYPIKPTFTTDDLFAEFASLPKKPPYVSTGDRVLSILAKGIPGFDKMRTKGGCPIEGCTRQGDHLGMVLLRHTIIHLNDEHKWTREKIADWLETLDLDLRFKTPEGGEKDE